ncbi:hypothetical protein ABZS98_39050 [Streptomyces avermitilis]
MRLAEAREKAGDQQGAERLYRAAADAGHTFALTRRARLQEEAEDQQGAERLYRAAANIGHTVALMRLAEMRVEAGDQQGAELPPPRQPKQQIRQALDSAPA